MRTRNAGGGGNFGIVTSSDYRLHPVWPIVLAGPIFHPFGDAREVLGFYASSRSSTCSSRSPTPPCSRCSIRSFPHGSPEATPRRGVAHNKEKKRGRVLYCQQLRDPHAKRPDAPRRGQVVAALSWHDDELASAPILITNLAIRGDSEEARALSRAAAGWMIAYLLEAARQDRRPLAIGVEIDTQPNADDFAAIGFRPAAAPAAYSAPYWAFIAPPGAPAR